MPVINGQVVRSRFTSLKLDELSSVDNPAQPGAVAVILKRHDPNAKPVSKVSGIARQVAKWVDEDDGAHTFEQVLNANNFDEKIWPMVSALSQSVRSIMGDGTITATERQTKVQESVDQFLASVRALDPPTDPATPTEVEKVEKALRDLTAKPKKDPTMKTVEQLEAEVTALKGQLSAATAEATAAKSTLETEQAAHATTKAALATATEEIHKTVDGVEIKKSEAGPMFAVLKASDEARRTAVFEKRADTEFAHLPGTTAERASALKAAEALPEDAQKATLAIFTAAEKMAAQGFDRLGSGGETPTQKAAKATFAEKVAEIEKRDNIPNHEAMSKARREHTDLYEQAYEQA